MNASSSHDGAFLCLAINVYGVVRGRSEALLLPRVRLQIMGEARNEKATKVSSADCETARKEAIIKEVDYLQKQKAIDNGHVAWQPRITPQHGFS